MNVQDIVEKLGLTVKAGRTGLEKKVRGGYCSDLLSDVMAHAREGDVWVTLQTHQNVVAVALLVRAAAVVLVGGREPAEDTAAKADEEGIPLVSTEKTAFEIVALLHDLGIGGARHAAS